MRKNELLEAINNSKARSAWDKGVKLYAYELVEALEVGEIPQDKAELKSLLLNGAADWKQYSWGGCSLIYDCDIAERLCCPSELKKTKGGELAPGYGREWLDVQGNALLQAYYVICDIVRTAT